jgi:hypothetical protein
LAGPASGNTPWTVLTETLPSQSSSHQVESRAADLCERMKAGATVQARIKQDRKYRRELLREGVASLLAGDLDTGKSILRDYINATIGFEELSRVSKRPDKRPNGDVRSGQESAGAQFVRSDWSLQRAEGLQFELSLEAAS